MGAGPVLLQVEALQVRREGASVLDRVDLAVPTGGALAVLGANGAGKSTLLAALAGLVPVAGGRVVLDGVELTGRTPQRIARVGLAAVPAARHLFPSMRVDEHLRLGARSVGRREVATRRAQVLDTFPRLADRLRQRAGTLSGGEQQMLAIARAMMGAPRVLVLDEPTTGLAPRVVHDLYAALTRLRDTTSTAVVVAEQHLPAALGFADEAVVLSGGRVVQRGASEAVARDAGVVRRYLGGGG